MELDVTHLYGDQTWIDLDVLLTVDQEVALYESAQDYYDVLSIEGAKCTIDAVTPRSFWQKKYDKLMKPKDFKVDYILSICSDFGDYSFKAVVSINTFGGTTVMGIYKTFAKEEEAIFAFNHSAEARRRTVIGKLRNVEEVNRFFLVDKSMDLLAEFLAEALQSFAVKSLAGPEV